MKALITLLALSLVACGSDDVLTGRFEVEATFNRLVKSPADVQCNDDYEVGEVERAIWSIDKGTKDCNCKYSLSFIDNEGRSKMIATSQDGYEFVGGGSVVIFDCSFNIKWETKLQYGKEEFTGVQTNTLTLSCAPGSCSEVWDLIGRPE